MNFYLYKIANVLPEYTKNDSDMSGVSGILDFVLKFLLLAGDNY